jgi:hypothetical protein
MQVIRRGLAVSAVLLAGCFQDSTAQHSAFLPLDYLSQFQAMRTCRAVADHGLAYERVFANDVAAAPYATGNYPLPAGSVVVGEQHGDPSCNSLTGFYLMAKENPGYDPGNHDWHWQRLDSNQRVLEDGKVANCSSCHAQPTCNDYLCAPP